MKKKSPLTRNLSNQESESCQLRPSPVTSQALLSYTQAASFLGISVAYLKELKAQGYVPWVPLGSRGVRFSVKSLERWIASKEIG
ncbi:MAG: helix-turn-helix transcriptional regulator [Pseudobdellovibrionaceae bacterium]